MPTKTGLRVLVVDDDETVRKYLTDALQAVGHQITCAPNGEVALGFCARMDFDVVITDFDMTKDHGEMNGIQFARSLASSGKDMRVILMSGDLGQAGLAGCVAAVQKPISLALLRALVGGS